MSSLLADPREHAAAPEPSVLAGASPGPPLDAAALHDLALDQLEQRLAATAGDDLARTLAVPLTDPAEVARRLAVFRALEQPATRAAVDGLLAGLAAHRSALGSAARPHTPVEAELWHVHAAATYLDALVAFAAALPAALDAGPDADALRELARACGERVRSADFAALRRRVDALVDAVRGVTTTVWVHGATVTVGRYDDEPDDAAAVQATFARFATADRGDHRVTMPRPGGMDEVQGRILAMTAQLHPDVFAGVHAFTAEVPDVTDPFVTRFADEVRFYLAYLDVLAPLRRAGLPVCYPTVRTRPGAVTARATYDLLLATRLVADRRPVVTNDLELAPGERLVVVTGPNQGGKTTLARTVGQLHHLAAAGCPVPGERVELTLADRVLTHFERPERLDNLEGRLGEALVRMRDLLAAATARSVVVLNEVFTSTSVDDARFLTREVLGRLRALDALTVCVTFVDDLATFDAATVSMVADVDPADPAVRTFRLTRRPADGRAYALALAERHALTPERIRRRLAERA
jgi:hypothetical protein